MRILVYPHAMELGGSQLNAVELAAAVRDRGHHVAVLSDDGPLLSRVRDLGLPHVPAVRAGRRPSRGRVRQIRRLIDEGGYDVIHGYEWPPILEAWLATRSSKARPIGTVMSMAVAGFLPARMPLVVGTRRIARLTQRSRPGVVHVLEPPVDTHWNRPGPAIDLSPAETRALRSGVIELVIVSRVVKELKLEGILTVVKAMKGLAGRYPVHLTVVGGGAQLCDVAQEAEEVNASLSAPVITLTGALDDPRAAYAAADICIGMGGSALRGLAFAKPLIIQGEGGFFETFSSETLDVFLEQGFYGRAERDQRAAVRHLTALLEPLIEDEARRRFLGRWGRDVVEQLFSLDAAAASQEQWYAELVRTTSQSFARDFVAVGAKFSRYKLQRVVGRLSRTLAHDDFNSRPA
jgi:glycosyltransferase involved in cell wall biosynthesis